MTSLIKVNHKLCTGCRLCEYACSAKHYHCFVEAIRIKIKSDEYNGINKPITCRQCTIPQCENICPNNAISIDKNGIININSVKCNKCTMCVDACPFNAIGYDSFGNIVVCDFCNGNPECVNICPSGALTLEIQHHE